MRARAVWAVAVAAAGIAVLQGPLVGAVGGASCPNLCNGRGSCGEGAVCSCDAGYTGNDCSERTCALAPSWVDRPVGDTDNSGALDGVLREDVREQEAFPWTDVVPAGGSDATPILAGEGHFLQECAGMGKCDRTTGLCLCQEGFTGHACQRLRCPRDCSGNGICRTVAEIVEDGAVLDAGRVGGAGVESVWGPQNVGLSVGEYDLWDAHRVTACVCDAGFSGRDCSRRSCPRGADPRVVQTTADAATRICGPTGCVPEVQSFTTSAASTSVLRLSVEYPAGTPRTYVFSLATDALDGDLPATNAARIESALRTTDLDGSFDQVSVSGTGSLGTDQTFSITFTALGGDLPLSSIETLAGPMSIVTPMSTVTDGTLPDAECADRGVCDPATGLCRCFPGSTGPACSQNSRKQVP